MRRGTRQLLPVVSASTRRTKDNAMLRLLQGRDGNARSQARGALRTVILLAIVCSVVGQLLQPAESSAQVVSSVLWRANHEYRTTGEWWSPEPPGVEGNNCGGEYDDAPAGSAIAGVAQNGQYGLVMRVPDLNTGASIGTRLFRWCEAQQHDALYYSAWYYIPQRVVVNYWWGIMEWKSPGSFNHKFMLIVRNRPDGAMYLTLERGMDSGGGAWGQSVRDLPVARWVHVEAYYKKATDASGRVTVWQDGTQILDLADVATANSADLRWAVINYGQQTIPSDVTIGVDGAAISVRRLGP
jgi:hypothetical protein